MNNSSLLPVELEDTLATGNILPLLNEIRHALQSWLDSNEITVIDLRGIPLAPGELDKLTDILGKGEVVIQLNALGPSEIYETQYQGVWLITHYNAEQEVVGIFIEITDVPEIIRSQRDDIKNSIQQLVHRLHQ